MLLLLSAFVKLLLYTLFMLFGLWCCYEWKYRKILSEARRLYPSKFKPLPIVGHIHHFVKSGWDGASKIIIEAVDDALEKRIDTLCFWIGPLPYILVMGAEDIQKVLHFPEKADEMKYLKYAGGNGLLTAPGNIWRITRRHINPLLHSRNLAHLIPTFNRNSRELVSNMCKHVDGPDFDVFQHTMKTALQTICHLIFGPQLKIDVESTLFHSLLIAVESVPEIFVNRLFKPWLRIDKIFDYVYHEELKKIKDVLKKFTAHYRKKDVKIYESPETRIAGQNKPDGNDSFFDNGPLTLKDVYSPLQEQYPEFTEETLSDEIATLYATGTDTVGATVATCLLALGQYPDVQDKLVQEIELEVQQDYDVTSTHLNNMPYLDQVYKETLRWSCLVPIVGRKSCEDVQLSSCAVSPGWAVAAVLAGVHMDPNRYPEPRVFNPERFSPKNTLRRGKYSFLPFSGGPRNCIGKEYSNLLVKVMLIHILRKYRISTDTDFNTLKRKFIVILVSSEGYKIKLHKRYENVRKRD